MAVPMTSPPLIVDIMMSRFGHEYEISALACRIAAKMPAPRQLLVARRHDAKGPQRLFVTPQVEQPHGDA